MIVLDEILAKMIEVEKSWDPESAHGEADLLLCEAILLLVRDRDAACQRAAKGLVDSWKGVDKWYA